MCPSLVPLPFGLKWQVRPGASAPPGRGLQPHGPGGVQAPGCDCGRAGGRAGGGAPAAVPSRAQPGSAARPQPRSRFGPKDGIKPNASGLAGSSPSCARGAQVQPPRGPRPRLHLREPGPAGGAAPPGPAPAASADISPQTCGAACRDSRSPRRSRGRAGSGLRGRAPGSPHLPVGRGALGPAPRGLGSGSGVPVPARC